MSVNRFITNCSIIYDVHNYIYLLVYLTLLDRVREIHEGMKREINKIKK